MSVNMAYALIAHLLLHLHQIMLVKHRIAASHPIHIAFQRITFDCAVGFKLGFPTIIAAQHTKRGKRRYQLHG